MAEAIAVYLIAEGVSAVVAYVAAYAITIAASVVVSQALSSQSMGGDFNSAQGSPNPGSRQQIPPAGDNKLPVVYGSAYVGGIITDLSISENNQDLYFVIALSEVTNTENGGSPDVISFGDIYYGGKLVNFQGDGYTVASLTDPSNGVVDTAVNGRIQIYLYNNGSDSPVNQSQSAITIMQADGLVYKWDNTKLMSNCAFAIIHLHYSQSAGVTSLQQTKFQITNARTDVGSCIYDYMTSTRYGAAISPNQVDTASINALNAYGNEMITYRTYSGNTSTLARFKFDGIVDTSLTIMQNFQLMASSCDCLIRYNEINALWAVVVQSPSVDYVMDLNDSNMVSSISISPIDISNTFNVVECKYPDGGLQDSFSSVTYDLATIDPALLFVNEPVNKQSISLYFVNNNVRVQLLANRFLKSAREDLQVQCKINYSGIQLEAGDIVTITNANYGWTAKPFRINKVTEEFLGDGMINASLNLAEYNAQVYSDTSITEFTPAPNTGIGDPAFFGTVPAPVVIAQYPTAINPSFVIQATTSSSGITQYAEVWYSAFANPLQEQMYFAGTSEIQSSGNPWTINYVLPNITLANVPAGSWYFFTRMVNSLASSPYSPASSVFVWQPLTFQFVQRYLVIAYADDAIGTGFTSNPRGKSYFGFVNETSSSPVSNPSLYTWLPADPTFGTNNYVLFTNRTGRKFSFSTGQAGFASVTGSFVPTDTSLFDPSVWSGLPDGTNYIDLDYRTGQLIQTGTTTVGTGEIRVTNNPDGRVVAALAPLLNFGGKPTYTASVVDLTIDIYGRVLGFEAPDGFGYTMQQFNATSGQTVFTVTRDSTYLINNCWVFQNGSILDETDYTDTGGSTGTVTLDTGASIFDIITIVSFRSIQNPLGTVYNSFSRNTVDLVNASSYTASGFTLVNGYELLFLNGTLISDQDYDITGQTITGFPNLVNGKLTVLQWTPNNLDVPNGTPVNVLRNTVAGQDLYEFSYVADALNIYQNGVLLDYGTDYTAGFGEYTLATVPTDANQLLLQQTFDRTTTA